MEQIKTKSKYFFNGVEKECSHCGEIKSIKDFGVNKKYTSKSKKITTSYFRSTCKKCYSEKIYRRVLERRIELFPNMYWDCDECDYIVHKKKDHCPKCNSKRSS